MRNTRTDNNQPIPSCAINYQSRYPRLWWPGYELEITTQLARLTYNKSWLQRKLQPHQTTINTDTNKSAGQIKEIDETLPKPASPTTRENKPIEPNSYWNMEYLHPKKYRNPVTSNGSRTNKGTTETLIKFCLPAPGSLDLEEKWSIDFNFLSTFSLFFNAFFNNRPDQKGNFIQILFRLRSPEHGNKRDPTHYVRRQP